MSDLQDWLDERERIQNMPEDGDFEDVDEALALFPRTLAALRNVLELHRPSEYLRTVPLWARETPEDDEPYHGCVGCSEPWPCTTFQAIQEAINDDE